MKKITIISMALILISFLFTSCQKAKEPEGKKEAEVQQEVKQQPAETKPDAQPQKQEQPPAAPTAKEEQPLPMEPSPLTEEDQKYVQGMTQGLLVTTRYADPEMVEKYLSILLKGNHKNIVMYEGYEKQSDGAKKRDYGDAISSSIEVINPTKKENFELIIRVLKEKWDYPVAVARAIKKLKGSGDKRVIELDKELLNHPAAAVRLEAAAALLIEGYTDTALPVLDDLAEEGSTGALYYLFSKRGKIIDERGYAIVEKALNYPKAEVRIHATKILLDSKKITKERAEEIALSILEGLKDKTLKDYGLLAVNPKESIAVKSLLGSNLDVDKAKKQHSSDSRACDYTVNILGELKSKRALSLLKKIEDKNTEWWFVCKRGIKEAIKAIEDSGGGGVK